MTESTLQAAKDFRKEVKICSIMCLTVTVIAFFMEAWEPFSFLLVITVIFTICWLNIRGQITTYENNRHEEKEFIKTITKRKI